MRSGIGSLIRRGMGGNVFTGRHVRGFELVNNAFLFHLDVNDNMDVKEREIVRECEWGRDDEIGRKIAMSNNHVILGWSRTK